MWVNQNSKWEYDHQKIQGYHHPIYGDSTFNHQKFSKPIWFCAWQNFWHSFKTCGLHSLGIHVFWFGFGRWQICASSDQHFELVIWLVSASFNSKFMKSTFNYQLIIAFVLPSLHVWFRGFHCLVWFVLLLKAPRSRFFWTGEACKQAVSHKKPPDRPRCS